MKKLIIKNTVYYTFKLLISFLICALLYIPVGMILGPFCLLRHVCNILYTLDKKYRDFIIDETLKLFGWDD